MAAKPYRRQTAAVGSELQIVSEVYPMNTIELFIYRAEGIRELERHISISLDRKHSCTLSLFSGEGDKIAVVLANCPFEVNEAAVGTMDAMENVTMRLAEDRPDSPFLSSYAEFRAGEPCRIVPVSLICEVRLTSVINWSSSTMTDVVAELTGGVSSAGILVRDGFSQSGQNVDTLRSRQIIDVGVGKGSVEGLSVHCYPNDCEASAGTPATTLSLCCTMNGRRRRFCTPLPPMRRQALLKTRAAVLSSSECRFEFY